MSIARVPAGSPDRKATKNSTRPAMTAQTPTISTRPARWAPARPARRGPFLPAAARWPGRGHGRGHHQPGKWRWLALIQRAALQPGETVLVLGATGVSGRIAAALAARMGAGRVIAADRNRAILD